MKRHPAFPVLRKLATFVLRIICVSSPQCRAEDQPATEAPAICERVLREYGQDGNIEKARAGFESCIKLVPSFPLPRFQLALLAQKEKKWDEALVWFKEYLKLDSSSELAGKIKKEAGYMQWVILYQATPTGRDDVKARASLAAGQAAMKKGEWQAALDKGYETLQFAPENLEAQLLCAAAQIQLRRFPLAEAMLMVILTRAPIERKPAIEQALANCRRETAIAEQMTKAGRLFADKRRTEAADVYIKIWDKEPEHYESLLNALECCILTENYSKARGLIEKFKARGVPTSNLPEGLRKPEILLAKLDQLIALSGKSRVATGTTASKSRPASGSKSGGSSTGKKTMAEDFLSRIKK